MSLELLIVGSQRDTVVPVYHRTVAIAGVRIGREYDAAYGVGTISSLVQRHGDLSLFLRGHIACATGLHTQLFQLNGAQVVVVALYPHFHTQG